MSFRKSISWAFAGQIAQFIAMFGGSVLIARLLTPHELGISAVAMATLAIIKLFAGLGVGTYVIRDPELSTETMDSAFTASALLAIGLSLIILATSFFTGPLLHEPAIGGVLRLLAIGPLFGIFDFRPSVMLQRDMRFRAIALIGTACVLVGTAVTLVAAWWGFSYYSPAIGGLVTGVVGTALNNVVGRRYVSFGLSLAQWRPMLVFGLRMMSIGGVATLAGRVSELVIGRVLGMTLLGLYNRASNLSNMIFENLYGTATRVLFVQLAKDFRETGALAPTFLRGLSMITAVMWPLLGGIGVLAGPAVQILYGERWLPAAVPLACLMGSQILTLAFGMNWELFVLRDETKTQTRIEVSRSAISVIGVAIGCHFGLIGIGVARLIDGVLGLILYLPFMLRLGPVALRDLARIYGGSGLLAIAALAPSVALMIAYGWSADVPFGMVLAAVALGILMWFALIVTTRHPLLGEFRIVAARVPGLRRFASAA